MVYKNEQFKVYCVRACKDGSFVVLGLCLFFCSGPTQFDPLVLVDTFSNIRTLKSKTALEWRKGYHLRRRIKAIFKARKQQHQKQRRDRHRRQQRRARHRQ